MKKYGEVDIYIHVFLTSVLLAGGWLLHVPAALTLGETAPVTHCIGECVGLKIGLDDLERRKILLLQGPKLRPFGHPARRYTFT
jgi:hypothetical protein